MITVYIIYNFHIHRTLNDSNSMVLVDVPCNEDLTFLPPVELSDVMHVNGRQLGSELTRKTIAINYFCKTTLIEFACDK